MGSYFVGRLLWAIPVVVGISLIVFGMMKAIPGDAAQVLAGPDATAADIVHIRQILGLDQPIYVQYLRWGQRMLVLDPGRSSMTGRPVSYEIATRVRPTTELALSAIVLAITLGLATGIISATHQYTVWDNIAALVATIGISMPIFWLGLILMMIFSADLRWLPSTGAGTFPQLILPAVTLGSASIATIARQTRSEMLEVLHQDYLRTARAKGLVERSVILHHAFKNAVIPIATVVGLQLGYLLSGTVLTETVFARPGLGRLLVDGIQSQDIPVVQSTVMLLSVLFVVINLLVDVLYVYVDPRIRYG